VHRWCSLMLPSTSKAGTGAMKPATKKPAVQRVAGIRVRMASEPKARQKVVSPIERAARYECYVHVPQS